MNASCAATLTRDTDHWVGRFVAMASPCEVLIDNGPSSLAQQVLNAVAAEAWRIERRFSRYRIDSAVHNINENAGPNAAIATVSRGTASPRSVAVEIEIVNGNDVNVPTNVIIPAGEAAISFPIGAIDNTLVDGLRRPLLRAYALATSSGERVAQAGQFFWIDFGL